MSNPLPMSKPLVDLAMSFYVGEPCRICGKSIKPGDLDGIIWAGYSKDDKSRTAHGECWRNRLAKESLKF